MVGDPHYMAPEQISGQGYGYGIDYWSLGILMYAMLHVETPFASHNSETKVHWLCFLSQEHLQTVAKVNDSEWRSGLGVVFQAFE